MRKTVEVVRLYAFQGWTKKSRGKGIVTDQDKCANTVGRMK